MCWLWEGGGGGGSGRRWEGGDSATVAVHLKRWETTATTSQLCRLEKHRRTRRHFFVLFCSVCVGRSHLRVSKSPVQNPQRQTHEEKGDATKSAVRSGFYSASARGWRATISASVAPAAFACRQRQTVPHWVSVCVSLVLTQMLWNTDCPVTAVRSHNDSPQLITDRNHVW